MVTDQQVRKYMKLKETERTLEIAAAKAGMSEKTARKYRRQGNLPSEARKERTWRTRQNVYKEVWPEIEEILRTDRRVQANTIFDYLNRKYEGRYQEGQLRTLQRQIKVWRGHNGPSKEVMMVQEHQPGKQCQSDYTRMGKLGVTIHGETFDHMFYHFTLVYSNWESGMVCYSESFESLIAGLQNGLWELGAVPEEHRTDSLSAAVNNLSDLNEWTDRYESLMRHYGLRASHNTPGKGHENGDVEQSHHRFKNAVDQELMMRGSRDFESREAYEEFLKAILRRRNAGRRDALKQEMAVMRELPERRLEGYTPERTRVNANSTMTVKGNTYSVPSQLIGEKIDVRVYAERIEVWYAGTKIEEAPRLRGQGKHSINYRHIADSLVRKPGAFAGYRYRSDLFPATVFRVAYDSLVQRYPNTADRQYVRILYLAVKKGQERVEQALVQLIESGSQITEETVKEIVQRSDEKPSRLNVQVAPIALSEYDALLKATNVIEEVDQWAM
jgi:hypothetical protein